MSSLFDTLVIGAGQAGLAAGYALRRAGRSFALLEAGAEPTGSWPRYYESLRLFSPARYASLPGLPFPADPEHYPLRDEVIAYLATYAAHFQLPIIPHSRVERVERMSSSFHVCVDSGNCYHARTVIVATGSFNRPHLPSVPGQEAFRGQLLHTADYRTPASFHDRRVIVVGAGNSAVQIAVELAQVAEVSLATRRPVAFLPQRLLSRDIHFWLWVTGLDRLPLGSWMHGREGGGRTPVLDTGRYQTALKENRPNQRAMFHRLTADGVVWADGTREQVDAVIFATGYQPNLDFLQSLGALDEDGRALQRTGVSLTTPGLYYVGLDWQRTSASATLRGVGPDAASVVNHLQCYLALAPLEEEHPPHSVLFSREAGQ
jgi:putative flavoprotein involved in K+ transport